MASASSPHLPPGPLYQVVCVGIVTHDIHLECAAYPKEDASVRALSQVTRPGGNAANTSAVLSLLSRCPASIPHLTLSLHLLASLGTPASSASALSTLHSQYHLDTSACIFHQHIQLPTSYILLSQHTGSRTIVHHRGRLPELGADAIRRVKASPALVHWEGRANVAAIASHMQHTRAAPSRTPPSLPPLLSLEIEKPREDIQRLWPLPDVLTVSREYALSLVPSATSATDFLASMALDVLPFEPHQLLVVPWGEEGAIMRLPAGVVLHCPAMEVQVVDSVGAGDTFIAALLYGVMRERAAWIAAGGGVWEWSEERGERLLRFACGIAGEKCKVKGLDLTPAVMERHMHAVWHQVEEEEKARRMHAHANTSGTAGVGEI